MSKIHMGALRIIIISLFVISVVVTVFSMLSMHNEMQDMHHQMPDKQSHMLHITHIALISLTFLLIALYLQNSAEIASLIGYREMKQRLTVDPSVGFIEHASIGRALYNACMGALARKGIYVKSPKSMLTLAKSHIISVTGCSDAREGYDATIKALSEMQVELTDNQNVSPVKIFLGEFSPESASGYDFVITHDKIAHVLAAVFVSRVFVRFTLYARVLFMVAIIAAAALLVFGQYTYTAAAIAFWSASRILLISQIGRRTSRMSFQSVLRYN